MVVKYDPQIEKILDLIRAAFEEGSITESMITGVDRPGALITVTFKFKDPSR